MASAQSSTTNTPHIDSVDEWETYFAHLQTQQLGESIDSLALVEYNAPEECHITSRDYITCRSRDYLTRRFNDTKTKFNSVVPPGVLIVIATYICYEDDVDTADTLVNFMEWCQSVIPPHVIIAELQRIRSPAYKVIHDFLMCMKYMDRLDQDIPECFGTICCIEPDKTKWETITYYESCHCGKRRCCCEYFDHISARCACGITELSIADFGTWCKDACKPTIIIPHLFTDINHLIEDIIPEPQVGMYVHSLVSE
jgi:hypothetical protein